jgi:hypothetical protein
MQRFAYLAIGVGPLLILLAYVLNFGKWWFLMDGVALIAVGATILVYGWFSPRR